MIRKCLIVLFVIIFTLSAFAQEQVPINPEKSKKATTEEKKTEDKDVVKLKEIVVTATRTEKEAEKAPGQVNVITQKEIETRNIKTIDEALDTLPGVFNRRQSLTDTRSSIYLRGMPNQKRTLIMKDGIILNNGYDGSASFTGLSTENIEKSKLFRVHLRVFTAVMPWAAL